MRDAGDEPMGGWPQAQRVMMIVSVSGARVVRARNDLVFCGTRFIWRLVEIGQYSFIIDTSFFCVTHTRHKRSHTHNSNSRTEMCIPMHGNRQSQARHGQARQHPALGRVAPATVPWYLAASTSRSVSCCAHSQRLARWRTLRCSRWDRPLCCPLRTARQSDWHTHRGPHSTFTHSQRSPHW